MSNYYNITHSIQLKDHTEMQLTINLFVSIQILFLKFGYRIVSNFLKYQVYIAKIHMYLLILLNVLYRTAILRIYM